MKEQANVPQIYWATGPWADCSVSCGNGTQKRQVVCHDHVRQLPGNYCQHIEKEPSERACNVKPCVKWTVGPWLPCPASCGIHHLQHRKVTCTKIERISNTSNSMEETDCDIETQPQSVRNCGLPACPREAEIVLGKWKTEDWQEVNITHSYISSVLQSYFSSNLRHLYYFEFLIFYNLPGIITE